MTIQYIEYGDNGKVAREKINGIIAEVEASFPSIGENGHWYIGNVDTGINAGGYGLKETNTLIKLDNLDQKIYVDLQIASGITPNDDLPLGVTVGKILETDGWNQDGLIINRQTTDGTYARIIYGDDGKIYFDGGNGTWNQIYKKSEVDGLFSTLRSELSTVAFSGDYADLNHKPTIGSGTLTIQKNGTTVNTFGANATSNVTANITVPTKTSDISNDSGYITKEVENLTNYTKTEDLPTVGTAKITIQKNGTKVDDFGVNDTSNKTINITMSKSDVGLGNVDNTSDLNKPISTATQSALDGKEDTISDLSTIRDNATAGKSASDTIGTYGDIVTHDVNEFATASQGGKADTAVQPGDLGDATITIQKNGTKVDDFTANAKTNKTINITMSKSDVGLGNVDNTSDANKPISTATQSALDAITGKIPSEASTSNKLADKDFVNSSINSVTAFYITKNAQGDQFATHAELTSATTFYSGGSVRVPTRNDYCIVADDEDHDHATTRYIYNSGWEYQYTVNETALTQAQLNALNSGITSAKVTSYDGIVTTVGGYGNIVTHNTSEFATSTQGGKADTALQPGDDVSDLVNDAGYITNAVDNLTNYTPTSSLGAVATSNDYTDLDNKPTIPTVNDATITIQKNGVKVDDFTANQATAKTINITVPTKVSDLTNDSGFITSASLPTKTSDLTNDSGFITSSDIPTNVSSFTNDAGYITSSSLPTVNDATLTIQVNGVDLQTFTANASSNVTANITVPTDTQDLTNTAGFITLADIPSQVSDTAYGSGWDGVTGTAPSKNAVYDKIESVVSSIPTVPTNVSSFTNDAGYITSSSISDTAYGSSWDGDTTHAPSKNAVYDVLGDINTLLANI